MLNSCPGDSLERSPMGRLESSLEASICFEQVFAIGIDNEMFAGDISSKADLTA